MVEAVCETISTESYDPFQDDEKTKTALWKIREDTIRKIVHGGGPKDFSEKERLFSLFASSIIQVGEEQLERLRECFQTLCSLNLVDAQKFSQEEPDPRLRAIFNAYVQMCEAHRSELNTQLETLLFSNLNTFRAAMEAAQLEGLIIEETNPLKLFSLQRQLFLREFEQLRPDMRENFYVYFMAFAGKDQFSCSDIDMLVFCPTPVKDLLRAYNHLRMRANNAKVSDIQKLLKAIYQGEELPELRHFGRELLELEEKLGKPIIGSKLPKLDHAQAEDLLSLIAFFEILTKLPQLENLQDIYSKSCKDVLDAFVEDSEELLELRKNREGFTKMSDHLQQSLLFSIATMGKLPDKALLFDLNTILVTNPTPDLALQFVKNVCAVARAIGVSNPDEAKVLLQHSKDLVDQTIYSWFSIDPHWTNARARSLLEIAKAYHLSSWEKPESLMQEVDDTVKRLPYTFVPAIRNDYGYSSNSWFKNPNHH